MAAPRVYDPVANFCQYTQKFFSEQISKVSRRLEMGYRRSWRNEVCVLAVMAQLGGLTANISQAQTSNTAVPRFAFGSIYGPAGRSGIYTYTMDPVTAHLRLADYLEISSLGGATEILGVEPTGRFAYTFVTDPQTGLFDIVGAQISQTNGSVTPIPGSPFACTCFSGSASSFGSTANVFAFDPTGSFVYVLSGTGPVANGILAFAIDSTTGALSAVSNSPFATGNGTTAIVIDPTGKFLYATNSVDGTISAFTRNTSTGALTKAPGSPFAFAPGDPGLIAVDPTAPFLYVSQFSTGFADSGNIVGYSVNTSTGALTALSNSIAVSRLGSMLIDPAGKFLYIGGSFVCDNSGDTVCGFSINASTGALTPLSTSMDLQSPGPLQGFDPSGKFIVQLQGTGDVTQDTSYQPISFNSSTGSLTLLPAQTIEIGAPTAMTGGSTATVRVPKFAYVANSGGGSVSAYSVNATTGVLSPISGSPYPAGTAPSDVIADPFGRFLFVANSGSDNVSAYTIDATTGSLTAVAGLAINPGSPFPAGTGPSALVTDPQGELLFVTNSGSNNLSVYSIDQTTGFLTQVTDSPFSTSGTAPAGVFAYGYQGGINLSEVEAFVLNSGSNSFSGFVANYMTLGDVVGPSSTTNLPGTSTPVSGLMDNTYISGVSGYYFIVNAGSKNVSIVNIAGGLSDITNFAAGTNPQSAAIEPTGNFLYVAGGAAGSQGTVYAYSLNSLTTSDGAVPTPINGSPFSTGNTAVSIAIDPSGQFAYVVNAGDDAISAYTLDSSTGALAAMNGTPFATGKNPKSIALIGAVESGSAVTTAPAVNLSPTSLTFPSQTVATGSTTQNIELTNTGNATLNLTGFTLTGADAGDFTLTNTCGVSVVADANCTITVTFTPKVEGSRTASVSIADNASGSPQAVSLSGTGVAAAPAVTLAPTSLTFPSQAVGTSSSAQSITLTNSGSAALNIAGVTITGANASDYSETNTCGATLAANADCAISVSFKPTATGTRTASVSIADNASGSPQAVSLSGAGVAAAPAVTLAPASLTFSSQIVGTSSTPQIVTLSNTGTAALSITGITITGTNAGDYSQTNTCGASVAASANCSITVTFKPTASGTRAASISIADNAGGSPQAVALSGTGAVPAPDFSVAASPASVTVTAGSSGTSTLTATPSNGFNQAVTFACSGLPSLATCTFAPTSVTPNGAAVTTTVTVSTTGTTTTGMNEPPASNPSGSPMTLALAGVFACFFSFSLGGIRKRNLRLLSILLIIAGLGLMSGCGGSSKKTTQGTPPGTYAVTVTATAGSGNSALSHATNISLVVQ